MRVLVNVRTALLSCRQLCLSCHLVSPAPYFVCIRHHRQDERTKSKYTKNTDGRYVHTYRLNISRKFSTEFCVYSRSLDKERYSKWWRFDIFSVIYYYFSHVLNTKNAGLVYFYFNKMAASCHPWWSWMWTVAFFQITPQIFPVGF